MKEKDSRKNKGITLIALVITIIILIILAGITIAMLTGDNGILTKATEATRENEINSVKEQAKLDISNYVAEKLKNGEDATVNSPEKVKEILDTANSDIENRYYKDVTGEGVETPNGYIVSIEEFYTNSLGEVEVPSFDENTLTIGNAINTSKYGWIVPEYTIKTSEMSSNIWKLFYQDSNYTYLITDEVIGSYLPSDYYSSYPNGSSVSIIGQRLSSMLLEEGTFFIESNINENMRTTAWLTDTSETSMWKEYKNEDAIFAIGSPTVELYAASFNATASANSVNQITMETDIQGYIVDNDKIETSYNYGIYNKSISSNFWISSPCGAVSSVGGRSELMVYGNGSDFSAAHILTTSVGIRPIVCIQTPVFNQKYTLSNPGDNS